MTTLNPDFETEVVQLAEDLRRSVGRFVRSIRTSTTAPTSAQAETLGFLERGEAMNTAKLAALRGVAHQSMRPVVEQLEDAGLIARTADPQDRRSQSLVITHAGRQQLEGFRHARSSIIADLIGRTLTIGERNTLSDAIELLDRLSGAAR